MARKNILLDEITSSIKETYDTKKNIIAELDYAFLHDLEIKLDTLSDPRQK